jgi:hypothetical protein
VFQIDGGVCSVDNTLTFIFPSIYTHQNPPMRRGVFVIAPIVIHNANLSQLKRDACLHCLSQADLQHCHAGLGLMFALRRRTLRRQSLAVTYARKPSPERVGQIFLPTKLF